MSRLLMIFWHAWIVMVGLMAPGLIRAAEPAGSDVAIDVTATLTPLEKQQIDQQRPIYHQPTPLEGEPPVTSLPLDIPVGETLVFLGNGLAERMEHGNAFETLLYRQFPNQRITFRNLGFPGHTPAFRPEAGRSDPWAFPGGEQFHPEIKGHFGEGHYPKPDEWLRIVGASTIVAFFGFNESFDGLAGVDNFRNELTAFVKHTRSRSYEAGGTTPPRLVLASPIACEPHPELALPDTQARNELLKAYAAAIETVAREQGVGFVDLFTPSLRWFEQAERPLTTNGVHLTQDGYRRLAPELIRQLFGTQPEPLGPGSLLQRAVADKAWYWRNDYRMLNGVHAYGRRWAPYGNVNYPEEIEKIRQMTVLRDRAIWEIAAGTKSSLDVDDSRTRSLSPVETNYVASPKNGSPDYVVEEAEALAAFTLPDGYAVSLFASERQFPNLGNPCQMRFDNRGRLWVSTLPSYPHYKPGDPKPDDKLLIYEDTDNDGRADKETVFAEGLHLPIGFELAPEGVYLSQEPFLLLLKDTDGDDRADVTDYLLDGFDPHDTHHAISAFDVDHGGGIYMCEGRFLHSQVETPWGPQRMTDGGVWRFDPHSWKVERVMQLDVDNPWGVAHDAYGQTFVNDASGGEQLWMLGYSLRMPHAAEMAKVSKFNYEHQVRPTSGSEFISSRHFPDEVQGDYLYANTIGFLGIKDFAVVEAGSELKGRFRQNLIQSSDGNFRPCDLEIGPDGSLFFLDWHNTLIGHMQHSARDPLRTAEYGRIYRITCPGRPLVEPPVIAGAPLGVLFENLKLPEMNARKRSHRELRGRDRAAVLAAAETFADAHRGDERLQLESLWASWGQQAPSRRLLDRCLAARDHRVRAAAVRVVRHCLHLLEAPERMLFAAAGDDHPRVRLEALSAASWLGGAAGGRIAVEVASRPTDPWIRNALNAAMLTLADPVRQLADTAAFDSRRLTVDFDTMLAGRLPGAAKPRNVRTASPRFKDKGFAKTYALGQRVFFEEGSCNTCHRDHGRGIAGIYPPLVGSEWVLGESDRLIKLTLHGLWGPIEVAGKRYEPAGGVPPMTALGLFYTDEEIAAVLTYVRTSWGNDAPAVDAATVARIRSETRGRRSFYTPEELLAEHPFPEGSRPVLGDEPPINPQLQTALAAEPLDALVADALSHGDPMRGAKAFFSEKLACATCHAADVGYQLGPQLTELQRAATPAHLIESILHPSKKIREGYQSVTVITADGEVLSGYLVSRSDTEVVLSLPTDKGGKRVLAADDLDEVILQKQSTMPADLIGQLENRQAFLDLASFVLSLKDGGTAALRRSKAAADKPADKSADKSADKRPNVLFIAIDDQNDWIGHMGGHPLVKTPNLDRLAARGTTFLNAHAQSPLCNPSRTSLMLGVRPTTTGIYGLEPWFRNVAAWRDRVTLPQHFRSHGYHTSAGGKIFHITSGSPQRQTVEFDLWGPHGGVGVRPEQKLIPPTPMGNHPAMDWGVFPHRDADKGDDQVASWTIEQIRRSPRARPFFIAAGFSLPHVPCYATQKWFDLYPDDDTVLPKVLEGDRGDTPRFSWYLHWKLPEPRLKWLESNNQWRNLARSYLACTSFVDAQIGRLLDALDESGLVDNTIVVVWSDHGFHLGEKGISGKNTLWDRSTRVPLIFAGPGVAAGQRCVRPAELLDIYPTLIDLCGLAPRRDLEGLSLMPQLRDAKAPRERPAITSHNQGNHGIRGERWRYIRYADGSEELYDMQNDPNEWHNLAGTTGHAGVIEEQRRWLPEPDVPLVPGSANRTLTYDPATDEAVWQGTTVRRNDPIPQ